MGVKIKRGAALSALNVMPLIDVVFLLLIFFLVTQEFREEDERQQQQARPQEKQLEVDLVQASEARAMSKRPNVLGVSITKKGEYWVDGELLDVKALQSRLGREALKTTGRPSIDIRPDKKSESQKLATLINMCIRLDLKHHWNTK